MTSAIVVISHEKFEGKQLESAGKGGFYIRDGCFAVSGAMSLGIVVLRLRSYFKY